MKTIQTYEMIYSGNEAVRDDASMEANVNRTSRPESGRHIKSRSRRFSRRTTQMILVPVDFTVSSLKALDHAILLAKRLNASVVILHVLGAIYSGGLVSILLKHKDRQDTRHRTLRVLHELAGAKMSRCVPISWVFRSGVVEYEILKCASQMSANLIVFGRRSRIPLRRLIFGSVSDDVADFSACPVLAANDNVCPPYLKCESHWQNGASRTDAGTNRFDPPATCQFGFADSR